MGQTRFNTFELQSVNLVSFEPSRGKTNNVVSEQVRHKPACTVTEKSLKLENLDLSRRGIVLYPCSENIGADQLCSYCTADLRLCFRLCRLLVFSCGGSYIFTGVQTHADISWVSKIKLSYRDPLSGSMVDYLENGTNQV